MGQMKIYDTILFLEKKYSKSIGNLLSVLRDLYGFVIFWLKCWGSFAIVINRHYRVQRKPRLL